jgi:hypothetical protein
MYVRERKGEGFGSLELRIVALVFPRQKPHVTSSWNVNPRLPPGTVSVSILRH